jgi:EmrB/QacA subfamily drug resistance transporter
MRAGPRRPMTPRQVWVLVLASMASFMISLDSLVVTTALSTIRQGLGASLEALEWTVNAYNLCFAVLVMTGAALGDRFGRRRVFTAGLGLFSVASAACALSPGAGWLTASRAVQGAGAALVLPLALALLSVAFPPQQRGRALGIFTSLTGLAALSGPVVGGAVAQGAGWQWIFWLNVPVGLLVILLARGRIQESSGTGTALDIRGLALATGAAAGLVWGLVHANSAGWASLEVLAAISGGVLLAAAFVWWGIWAREPMVPMRLFRSRAFAAGNAAGFLLHASMYGTLFFLAQFLQAAQGHGPLGAGLRLLPASVCLFFLAPVAGRLVDRIGERPLLAGGLLLQAAGTAWIGLLASPGRAYPAAGAALAVAGVGVATALPAAQNAVVSAVARAEVGTASGTFTTLRFLGGVVGVAVAVAMFATTGSYASPQTFTDGFVPAMIAVAVLALLGAGAALAVPGRRTGRAGAVASWPS